MGKKSRTKGHSFERWCANAFKNIFPDARRHLENHKDDAAKGIDLVNTGRYRVQCKRFRRYASITRIFQVQICPIDGGCPVLVTQADRQEAMAVLPFDELLRLIRIAERK